jgi:hypothetical protein
VRRDGQGAPVGRAERGAVMGRDGDLIEDDGSRWWWQVLSCSSAVPVLASGRADDDLSARIMVEAAMVANQSSFLGMSIGPGGQAEQCRRTVSGDWKWLPWP